MSHNSSWTLTQTGEARTWTLTQDGESRTFTIAPGVGPVGPAGPSNITTSTSTDITGILKGDGASVGAAVADTDYQSVPAEGAFADGDKTKLDGIESGADVTDATNVNAAGAVMESDYSPAHSVLAQQSGTGSPSAVTLGTNAILGRTTGAGTSITGLSASDVRTMLNVEDGATADQTDFEILTAWENATSRSATIDGLKLDSIEPNATADQTASEILTAIKTVDGTGSGLDADLLDGQEASAFAAASHTHVSADITDATDDGSIPGDRGKILKTDSSGQVKALGVFGDLSVGGGFGLIDGDPDGSFTNYGIMVGNNITGGRTIELPDAEGTLALTSQTDGSIHAEDLDFAGSTDIGADLADADEILVSDGGGNTTRRKSALSRVWTYIKAKIESVALSTLEVTGDLTVDTDTLRVNAATNEVTIAQDLYSQSTMLVVNGFSSFDGGSGVFAVNSGTWNGSTITGNQTFSDNVVVNGSITSPSISAISTFGRRMRFDGSNDRVSTGYKADATSDFFVEATFVMDQLVANQSILADAGTERLVQILTNASGQLQANVLSSAGIQVVATGATTIVAGQVYTVRLTHDVSASRMTLDLNGVQDGTGTYTGTFNAANYNAITVGAFPNGSLLFKGLIYDVNFNNESSYQGYGNTNADWEDQVGSNDGTVSGSPELVYFGDNNTILSSDLDIFGDANIGGGSITFPSNSGTWNGATIAGDQTMSGQVELTGQSASTDDSAMTRSLVATESTLTTPEPIGFSAPTKSGTTFTAQAAYGAASFYLQVSSGATVGHYSRVESTLEPWVRVSSGANMELAAGEMSWIFDLYVNTFQSNEARVLIGTATGKTVLDVAGWGVVFTSASSCKLQSHNGSALSESSALTLNANLGISNYHRFMVVANAGTVYLYQRHVAANNGALGRWVLIGSLAGSSLPTYSSGLAISFNNIATGTMGGSSNLIIKNPTYLHQAITP